MSIKSRTKPLFYLLNNGSFEVFLQLFRQKSYFTAKKASFSYNLWTKKLQNPKGFCSLQQFQ